MDMHLMEALTYYAILVNLAAFAAFGNDKSHAEAGRRRISELTLLTWAFLGGTPGAYAGRALFRHKTRKQPFSNNLNTIAILQIAAVIGVVLVAVVEGTRTS